MADGRQEAPGCNGRAGAGDHVVEGLGEGGGMREGGVFGMVKGKGFEVGEVSVSGATCPRTYGSCQGVGRRRTGGSTAKGLSKEGKIVWGNLGIRGGERSRGGGRRQGDGGEGRLG